MEELIARISACLCRPPSAGLSDALRGGGILIDRNSHRVTVMDRAVMLAPRTVDVHVRRPRKILEPFGIAQYIQTVTGSGYRFSPSVD